MGMNTLKIKKLKVPFEDLLARRSEQPYFETAIGIEKTSDKQGVSDGSVEAIEPSKLSKKHTAMTGQKLLTGTSCHEYLALDVMRSSLEQVKTQEKDSFSIWAIQWSAKADKRHGHLPGAWLFPDGLKMPSFYLDLFLLLPVKGFAILVPYLLALTTIFMVISDGLVDVLKGIFFLSESKDHDWLFWGLLALIPLDKFFDFIASHDWHRIFDPKDMPVLGAIRRNSGHIRLMNNNDEWADIPFAECTGYNVMIPTGQGGQTRKLTIRHDASGKGLLLGESGVDGWHPALLWEYYQHYMDVSRPLPDVPFFEPYRHLDPTTRKWDEEHNRPPRLWRDMDNDTYVKLVDEAIVAAKAYPFLEPEKAEKQGWTPAGDGQHWYQRG